MPKLRTLSGEAVLSAASGVQLLGGRRSALDPAVGAYTGLAGKEGAVSPLPNSALGFQPQFSALWSCIFSRQSSFPRNVLESG